MSMNYGQWYTLEQARYEDALGRWFLERTGKTLDLEHPQTFSEKIQWLKLYDSTPLKTRLADKYLVRDWVRERLGEQYLTPLICVCDSYDDVDFDALPERFALKPNHGAGYHCIVADRAEFDAERDRPKAAGWLREDFAFRNGLELHYHGIRRRVLVEEHMSNGNSGKICDYKVLCFHGKAHSIMFMGHIGHNLYIQMFDLSWNLLPYTVRGGEAQCAPAPRPDNLEALIDAAQKLAEGFAFVRVDFYRLDDGSLRFGEMTFTPGSGVLLWTDERMDLEYGKLLTLPQKRVEYRRSPALSVALSGYAGADAAGACLQSLIEGTLEPIEILCCDDGADAAVTARLEESARRDARIRRLNLPAAQADELRNHALENACGEYIVFLYADGAQDAEILRGLCEAIAQQRADIALCGGTYLRAEQGGGLHAFERLGCIDQKKQALFSGADVPPAKVGAAASTLQGMMLRRSFIERAKLRFGGKRPQDDAGFALRAVSVCARITAVQDMRMTVKAQPMDAQTLVGEAKRLREADAACGAALAWMMCLYELKKAGGAQYEALYRGLKGGALAAIGLDGAADVPRAAQLRALLSSGAMIRFE